MSATEVVDRMAQAMCAVETRSKAATLEEVQAGIQRWTRHRYEAEQLLAELADYGLSVVREGVTPDWRVLGGLVPGVINAAWLRNGDHVRLNKLDGTVHLHTVDRRADAVRFVFVTDTGQVRVERSLDSEVLVLTPTEGADQ